MEEFNIIFNLITSFIMGITLLIIAWQLVKLQKEIMIKEKEIKEQIIEYYKRKVKNEDNLTRNE